MKVFHLLVSIVLISLLALTGCSKSVSQQTLSSATYIDDIGRTVQIQGIPQRIISLSPSNTEIVYALGLDGKLVGITSYDNYPPDVKNKTVVSDYSTIDMEKIVDAKPDLVLADSIHKNDAIPALEKLGITVYTITPANMDMIFSDLKVLGQITGKTEEADNLVSNLKNRIQAVIDNTAELTDSQKPRVLFVTWHDPIWTAGNDTMIQYLIEQSGGSNIAGDLHGYATITMEAVIQRNPQIIIVMSSMGTQNTSLEFIKSNDKFQITDALKNGQVYEIDTDIFSRTTPRIVDGLETLAKIVHPELLK